MFGISLFKKKPIVQRENKSFVTVVSSLFESLFPTTSKTSLSLVPVYASIKIISQNIAIANMKMYKKSDNGREEIEDHKLSELFKKPFMEMTYFNWMQMMMLNLVGYGNAYALIVRDINYNVKELIPLEYDMVSVYKDSGSNVYYYQVSHNAKSFKVFPEDMLHYKVFSSDGIRGLSPIELHKSTIGSLDSESDYLDSFYKNAANLSGTIESEGVNAKQIDAIKESFDGKYSSVSNSGKTIILPNGMKYKQLKLLSPMDANYIETAKLNRADVAVIFGLPLALLGDLSQATYSNITELNRAFYKMTVAPYFTAIAQENDNKLLLEAEKSNIYSEFDPEILLSATKKERYDTYAVGIDNGIITRNEARKAENLESIDGLDEIMQKSGVMTIDQADENFKNNEVSNENNLLSDAPDAPDNDSSTLSKDINSLKMAIKNSGIKNQSDVLSHLGRISGLVETSEKTSIKDVK